jgi:hypothetical protein
MGLKAVYVLSRKGQGVFFYVNVLCTNFSFDTLVHTLVVNMHKFSVLGMHDVQTYLLTHSMKQYP